MQALIFAATTGLGLFMGTQFAGIVMDKNSVEGKFQWSKIWSVPCVITLLGVLVLAAVFQNPAAERRRNAHRPPSIQSDAARFRRATYATVRAAASNS